MTPNPRWNHTARYKCSTKRGHVHDSAGAQARVIAGVQIPAAPGEIAPGVPFDGLILAAAHEAKHNSIVCGEAVALLTAIAGYITSPRRGEMQKVIQGMARIKCNQG